MTTPIRIVTDSAAQFIHPDTVKRYHITVVPLGIRINGHDYYEGVDLSTEQFNRKALLSPELPQLLPPSAESLAQVYAGLHRETNQILSIHLSRAFHPTWENAKKAAEILLGRCDIAVLDSQSIAVGQGLLVEAAARLAEQQVSLDDIMREIRKLVPHIYSVFCVERLGYLTRANLMMQSQVVLGEMLGIKPFLTIEDGELLAMEKARSRLQAVDRLVEFATEFAAVEQIAVLHSGTTPSEQTRQLLERMSDETQRDDFPVLTYQPSLGCFIGPDALGIMIYEREFRRGSDEDTADLTDLADLDDEP